ncbi:MAG: ROK family protein [Verrucomicrobia bacterium]|nr:ROK family protein [Verrucomicrobiota bacterium]
MASDRALLVRPQVIPTLDPDFRPAFLWNRAFAAQASASKSPIRVSLAVEQTDGSIFHHSTSILPEHDPGASANFTHLERLVKFLLWSRGGFRIHFDGPKLLAEQLRKHYAETPTGRFDASIMGERVYERPFEIVHTPQLPPARSTSKPLGRYLKGCRIGFDLGGSDRKVAAVIDGQCVFSEETIWNPVPQADPQWHFDQIMESLKLAARHLPRVDAIGGSSAGVIVNNRIKVASLFRGVPLALFNSRVKDLFLEMRKAWGGIPFEVANDGEVTALAGSMALEKNGVLGIAMGTSMAGGYVNPSGNITTWLNELAFAPVDYNPHAAVDEWSGDAGCGVQYFSQQCVGRLLPAAGIEMDWALPLPEKLKHVQELMRGGDDRATKIFQTIAAYLGYAILHYTEFYDFHHVLILGRVTSGVGGDVITAGAREVLSSEAPELSEKITLHSPDEKEKRHGQAIAAASLPGLFQGL